MTIFLFTVAAIVFGIVYVATTVKADFLSLAIALCGALLCVGILAAIEGVYQGYKRRCWIRERTKLGKVLPWSEVAAKLTSGDGTAIISHQALYWHPDEVSAAALERLTNEAYEKGTLWNVGDVLGFLTKCPRRLLAEKSLRRAFPHARVVSFSWSMVESVHVE